MRSSIPHIALLPFALAFTGCPDQHPAAATSSSASASPSPRPATSVSKVRAPGPDYERFAMPNVQGLIVGEAAAGRFYAAITGGTSPRYWTPQKADLIDLENRLGAYLRRKAPPSSNIRNNLRTYRRQYIGIVRGDDPFVFVNFFCETNRTDWTRKPIAVEDGGDCYFQLQFDPETHKFSGLTIQKGS